jgi:membrane fusion protein (multidrug efflux system)
MTLDIKKYTVNGVTNPSYRGLKMVKTRIGLFLAVIMLLGWGVAGCKTKNNAEASKHTPNPEVGVVVVEAQSVALTTELPGRTSAYQVAEVRPQVSGIIQKRLFTEGSEVKAGEVLYQIDPATYKAAHSRAKAELARAEANLITLRLREKRYSELVNIHAISQQEYDDAHAALKQAEAEIEAARAALETAQINLDYTQVKAPISGRIGRSSVTTGALVISNQPAALATIHQLDPMYVDVTQSTSELLELRRKQASGRLKKNEAEKAKVRLVLEAGDVYPQQGILKFSDVNVDQSTGSVILRTVFPNPEQILLPGMFVRAVIGEGVTEQAILVPQQGVGRNPKGEAIALVVDENDTVEQRKVMIDRSISDKWLVSSGLSPGDRLIVEGSQKVRPGSKVKVVFIEEDTEKKVIETQGMASQKPNHGGA